jgi:hypothetical protein
MKFIEMTGKSLLQVINEGDLSESDLKAAGLQEESLVRINQQGDIEIRRARGWDVIGGLLGEFEQRVKHETGLDWA